MATRRSSACTIAWPIKRLLELDGPAAGLAIVDRLAMPGYALFHGIRADLLRRLGNPEAQREYARAVELATNEAERAFYRARLSGRGGAAPR